MTAVFKHELRAYLHSFVTYLFCAFLLIFTGIGAMLYNIQSAVANFEYVLQFICIVTVVILPILTMRIISDEKKQRTDKLLYSLPISTGDIVIGKYLAVLLVFLVPMLIIAVYPLIFKQFGDVYLLTSYGAMLAFYLMGAAMIAVGMFISSLTENQGIAAGITIPLLLFNYFSVSLADYVSASAFGSLVVLMVFAAILSFIVYYCTKNDNLGCAIFIVCVLALGISYFFKSELYEGLVPAIMQKLSLFSRFSVFVNGIFDITSIVFYLTVAAFFVFLTIQSLEKRRYN